MTGLTVETVWQFVKYVLLNFEVILKNQQNLYGGFFLNNQPDALIILILFCYKLYMFRASSLHIIRSFLLYIRHW